MTTGQILINKEICDYRYPAAIIQFQDFDIYILRICQVSFPSYVMNDAFCMMERKARSLVTIYIYVYATFHMTAFTSLYF